ncbi:hypothetical protein [Hymenobacter sp. HSC-4F20]|uniref:hypothetical protein n=1 Tax=Hymenobacter sp. HSC-4F20 TaxID=2864135 RepID=UPI002175D512|nr:hypothetical protein [Hymenobacter sp. HSC-4F20]
MPAQLGQRAYDKHTGRLAQVGLVQQVHMGLLPTPMAADATRGKAESFVNDKGEVQRKTITANGRPFAPQFTDVAPFLPTPTVHGNHNAKGMSANSGDGLSTAVKKLLPTPTAQDGKNSQAFPSQMERNSPGLAAQAALDTNQPSGSLNPRFVAQMMGYPPDWCELSPEQLAQVRAKSKAKGKTRAERTRLKATATP